MLTMPSSDLCDLESISPTLWRASQLARGVGEVVTSGHRALAAELPGGGWPKGGLTELLMLEAGSAELQLLRPALAALQTGRIALLHPPYSPQILALGAWGIDISRLLWLPCQRPQDAVWAAEQILKNGACSALLFWQNELKSETLRRLHLAAQTGRTLFFLVRSWKYQDVPSPAPLRLKLNLLAHGLQIDIIKRRGPPQAFPLLLPWSELVTPDFLLPYSKAQHVLPTATIANSNTSADMDRDLLAATRARGFSGVLAG